MGWYVSMIVIKNTDEIQDENQILEALDLSHFKYSEEVNMNEVFHPRDNSVSIGFHDDFIIICDDFRFTDLFFTQSTSDVEEALIELFPTSNILSICYMSNIDFKGYAVIKNGEKVRFKTNEESDNEDTSQNMMGDIPKEELMIFEDKDFEFISQMVNKVLGLDLESDEANVLYDDYIFKKYIPVQSQNDNDDFDEEFEDDSDDIQPNAKSDSAKPWWQFWK